MKDTEKRLAKKEAIRKILKSSGLTRWPKAIAFTAQKAWSKKLWAINQAMSNRRIINLIILF